MTASHFGGGGGLLRKKTSGEQQEEGGSQRAKSRQELIEELILKSKQEKVSSNTELPHSILLLKGVPCPQVSVNNMYFIFAHHSTHFPMFSGSDRHRKRKHRC